MCLAFRNIFLFLIVFLPSLLYTQESRTGISAFFVPEKGNLPIGFTSFDAQTRLLKKDKVTVDYGLRFIGATTGTRGGFFAFGYFTDLTFRPAKKLQPGLNLAFLAGGGSAAPDGDGWMIQGNVFTQYRFENGLIIRGGVNYAAVSGGMINGFSPLLGISWKLKTIGSADSVSRGRFGWSAVYAEAGRGIFNGQGLSFIGAGARVQGGRFLAGDVVIHAITNRHGGYMQILGSGGPDLALGDFHLTPALVLGLGGGGGIDTQGGGLYGWQAGLSYTGRLFFGGIKYQDVTAWSNRFDYKGVFVSVGRTFHDGNPELKWDFITKAYVGDQGFGNIGARFTAFEYKKLRFMASTFWAFTDDMGAYAEGLFEASLTVPGKVPLYVVGSAGAGAGSGINHRSGSFIYSGGVGITSPFNKLPLALEGAYWAGGNIPNWSLALSYRIGRP